jgi:membrane-bound lytic murein transglycosylase D
MPLAVLPSSALGLKFRAESFDTHFWREDCDFRLCPPVRRVTLLVTLRLILSVVLIQFLNVKAMSLRAVLSLCSSLFLGVLVARAEASPVFASNERYNASATDVSEQGPFGVPAKLRGRVDFWKDVFAKYGNKQVVVHHRDFPQIVFGVLDFSAEAQTMGPIELDRHMDRVEKQTVSEMREQIRALINGQEPSTAFQKSFVQKMQQLPPEARSYKDLLDEDLIRTQTGIRERYAQAMMRAWRYLPTMEQIFVSEYGLPKELTRLPFIESSFDYTAYSNVGAAGIWQFMPRTARAHRMVVGRYVDERRDPIKATRAAAEYLRSAYQSLGSWPLAITSYNHGVGGVRSKVRAAGTDDLAHIVEHPEERYFGFASSNFYPEFLAAVEIFRNHERYFPEIPVQPALRLASYPVRSPMSTTHAAQQLGISIESLKEANYALLDPVWKGRARIPAGYVLQVPVKYNDKMAEIETPEPLHSKIVEVSEHPRDSVVETVRRGESVERIASDDATTSPHLMQINQMSSRSLKGVQPSIVATGPARPSAKKSTVKTKSSKTSVSKSVHTKHKVRNGETLFSISKHYRCSVNDLKRFNRIKGTRVDVGQVLVIP